MAPSGIHIVHSFALKTVAKDKKDVNIEMGTKSHPNSWLEFLPIIPIQLFRFFSSKSNNNYFPWEKEEAEKIRTGEEQEGNKIRPDSICKMNHPR